MELSKGCMVMLRKMLRQERIGGRNIPEALIKSRVKDLPKDEHRQAMKDWETCIKEGLILTKPKPYGTQVSLNPRKLKEIRELTEEKNEN